MNTRIYGAEAPNTAHLVRIEVSRGEHERIYCNNPALAWVRQQQGQRQGKRSRPIIGWALAVLLLALLAILVVLISTHILL